MPNVPWNLLIVLAGLGQLAIVIGSLAIPKVLGWKEELRRRENPSRQLAVERIFRDVSSIDNELSIWVFGSPRPHRDCIAAAP